MEGGVAIVPENATDDPVAAVLLDERAPAMDVLDATEAAEPPDATDDAPPAALAAETDAPAAVEIVPAPEGLTRRMRARPRPRTGNAVPEADVAAMFRRDRARLRPPEHGDDPGRRPSLA